MIKKLFPVLLLCCMGILLFNDLQAQSRFVIYKWTGRHAKVGMIDSTGTVIVKPKLSDMGYPDFRFGPVPAKYGKKWGYIDENGKWVIGRKFDWARLFSNGLARVEVDEKFGFINHAGEWVIPPKFNHAWPFYDELALANAEVEGKIIRPLRLGKETEIHSFYSAVLSEMAFAASCFFVIASERRHARSAINTAQAERSVVADGRG